MNYKLVAIGTMIVFLIVGLSGCTDVVGKNEFKIINKCNEEIEVTICAYDGCIYDDNIDSILNDGDHKYCSVYVDANSEKIITNEIRNSLTNLDDCTYLDISTSKKHTQFEYLDDIPIKYSGLSGMTLTFHANGIYDIE